MKARPKLVTEAFKLAVSPRPLQRPIGYSWEGRSKYIIPHQGKRECARRVRQMSRGV